MAALSSRLRKNWLRILVHAGALSPLVLLIWDYFHFNLTANPIQEVTFRTGRYTLVLLILSLTCTPVNLLFGYKPILRVRRTLGLYAFMYAGFHFLIFVGLDYGFDWNLISEGIFEKRYALVGFAAFIILLSLAITSTKGWQRRLGRRWKHLHRLVYLAGMLAIVHFVWLVKSDFRRPLLFGLAVTLLLLVRVPRVRRFIGKARMRRSKKLPATVRPGSSKQSTGMTWFSTFTRFTTRSISRFRAGVRQLPDRSRRKYSPPP
jgi:methionine sulfoxide reductase heme-binding subunit